MKDIQSLNIQNQDLTWDELQENTYSWGVEKGIIPTDMECRMVDFTNYNYALIQSSKTLEEVAELVSALTRCSEEEVFDAYGDILVTLLMGMAQLNIEPRATLEHAYKIISNRTGKMVDGKFVKDQE